MSDGENALSKSEKVGTLGGRTQEVGVEATPTVITYTHDLWNRLVKVQYTPNGGAAAIRVETTHGGSDSGDLD